MDVEVHADVSVELTPPKVKRIRSLLLLPRLKKSHMQEWYQGLIGTHLKVSKAEALDLPIEGPHHFRNQKVCLKVLLVPRFRLQVVHSFLTPNSHLLLKVDLYTHRILLLEYSLTFLHKSHLQDIPSGAIKRIST